MDSKSRYSKFFQSPVKVKGPFIDSLFKIPSYNATIQHGGLALPCAGGDWLPLTEADFLSSLGPFPLPYDGVRIGASCYIQVLAEVNEIMHEYIPC